MHPIKCSKLYLAILSVRGLDKDYPVEQVIGRDHLLGSSNSIEDKDVAYILRQVSVGDLHLTSYMKNLRKVEENDLPEGFLESSLLDVSGFWLEKIYEAKGYPEKPSPMDAKISNQPVAELFCWSGSFESLRILSSNLADHYPSQ